MLDDRKWSRGEVFFLTFWAAQYVDFKKLPELHHLSLTSVTLNWEKTGPAKSKFQICWNPEPPFGSLAEKSGNRAKEV